MTTNINPLYMIAPSLQEVFRDKDTGLPLINGYIEFYKDQDRTDPPNKVIYKLSGSPGNYSYTALPNPLPLTGIGTLSDGASNDILPYYYPYDENGNIELYYMKVYNSAGVFQFDRQAFPNLSDSTVDAEDLKNYIPNGQFKLHNNIPADTVNGYSAGEIRQPITVIAPGGWTFERPNASTATDIVTFARIGSYTDNPTASPRYKFNINTQIPSPADAYKDLRIKFNDVNKFASDEMFTFAFYGQSNSGGTAQVSLVLIQNFGTGGSSTLSTTIDTFTIGTTFDVYQTSFSFGDLSGHSIGIDDDDYLQLALRFPTAFGSNIDIDDVVLTPGQVNVIEFPQTPDSEFVYKSLAGGQPIPNYDGWDLYLPVVVGENGYQVDNSQIGEVGYEVNLLDYTNSINTITNKLLCDGSQYLTNGYSLLGIPYARLQAKLWNSTYNVPFYGTGKNYATSFLGLNTNTIGLHPNSAGSVTTTADGSVATGFTFATVATGNTGYYTQAYWLANNQFLLQNVNAGAVAAVDASNVEFTTTEWRKGSTLLQETTLIQTLPASDLAHPGMAGYYFKLQSYNSGALSFYVWYQITNETDPAPSGAGTGIKIKLDASDTDVIVAQKTANVLNGWQVSTIATLAASAIPQSSYWIFNSTADGYYVWYNKDGAGTDPVVAGRTGIEVDIVTADTNAQVASKTIAAINSVYFAVPDFRGQFLEGYDPNRTIDKSPRFSLVENINGMMFGTFQLDDNLSHVHNIDASNTAGGAAGYFEGIFELADSHLIHPSGSYNSRPRNAVVNTFIRY